MLPSLRRAFFSESLVLWLCGAYVVALAPITPGFISSSNLANILSALLPLLLVGLGETLVLIAGGIDLSVTSTIAFASIMGARVMTADGGWLGGTPFAAPAAVLVMLAVGVAVGAVNGAAIVWLRMPAFIVTLTTMMAFSGLAIWLTQSRNIAGLPGAFTALGENPWLALAIAGGAAALVHLLLSRSLFGRWLRATGANRRAALLSGVPVNGIAFAAYVACGACSALAAVLYTGQAETGSPVLGQHVLLDVLGGTVIGGTSLFGGKGKVLWTVYGVLFLTVVDNTLNLLGLSIFTITMVKGGLILLAAVLDAARTRLEGVRA